MKWTEKNVHGGQLVAAQTTSGDFKDVHIITSVENAEGGYERMLVSLLDGYAGKPMAIAEFVEYLNKHQFAPCPKVLGGQVLPENRAELPIVHIRSLRDHT